MGGVRRSGAGRGGTRKQCKHCERSEGLSFKESDVRERGEPVSCIIWDHTELGGVRCGDVGRRGGDNGC